MKDGEDLPIRSKSVARLSAAAIAAVVLLHVASQVLRFGFGSDFQWGLAPKVYLGGEISIPNWLSTILLLACAVMLFVIRSGARGRNRLYWGGLALLFTGLSLDESAALHDVASPFCAGIFITLARTVGGPFVALARKPNYAWEIPGAMFCLVVGMAYVPFLMRLPRATRNLFIAAGCTYVGGAVVVDFFEGWYAGVYGPGNPVFALFVTCEESLEMIGAALFLFALVRYAESEFGGVTIRLSRTGSARPPLS